MMQLHDEGESEILAIAHLTEDPIRTLDGFGVGHDGCDA